jgi:hypothetical protein
MKSLEGLCILVNEPCVQNKRIVYQVYKTSRLKSPEAARRVVYISERTKYTKQPNRIPSIQNEATL